MFLKIVSFVSQQVNVPMSFAPPKDDSLVVQDLPHDLSTIGMEAFASLGTEVTASPLPLANTTGPLSTQDSPATPARCAVNTADPVSTPVSEDLIQGCVTPQKVQGIQKALEKERVRHKCALKLLPFFFTREELTKNNTDGSHGKERLDATKLNSLKALIFSKFPIDCPVKKEKLWRNIKGRINSKCRAKKFAYTGREDQKEVM